MFKKITPDKPAYEINQFPHCDSRILHAPKICSFCDERAEWQALRIAWGIAFTGFEPDEKELPDPATFARGTNINLWYGNRPNGE